jgi:hypothetical protein
MGHKKGEKVTGEKSLHENDSPEIAETQGIAGSF